MAQVGEEPPFLTVGTEVSAKYRGAFCEASIKSVKKVVKCKVTFSKTNSSITVNDDCIKGTLKVGTTVEAKSQDGQFQEAVIIKLTDASVYTVVFDDGDERTLRRTSLCLKGERHFNVSETLDHLPLTDPENFGTPVMQDGKKRKKRSLSQAVSMEDSETEKDEGEPPPSKKKSLFNDSIVGKVVVVENHEKKKQTWFPGLGVSPNSSDSHLIKTKDQCLVRSFKDGKYHVINVKNTKKFARNAEHVSSALKGDNRTLKLAIERALSYEGTGKVPINWEDTNSSNGEEAEDEETSADLKVQRAFSRKLFAFMEERGTPIVRSPVLGNQDLNLHKLYKLVKDIGGMDKVSNAVQWRTLYSKMDIPVIPPSASHHIKMAYKKYLYPYEMHEKGIDVPGKDTDSERSNDDKASEESGTGRSSRNSLRIEEKERQNEAKQVESKVSKESEKTKKHENEELEVEVESDVKSPESEVAVDVVNSPGIASDESDQTSESRSEDGSVGSDFIIGDKIQVKYGRGRNHRLYEAKIISTDTEADEGLLYCVHYAGWNNRYDEWIKPERISGIGSRQTRKRSTSISKEVAPVKGRKSPPKPVPKPTPKQSGKKNSKSSLPSSSPKTSVRSLAANGSKGTRRGGSPSRRSDSPSSRKSSSPALGKSVPPVTRNSPSPALGKSSSTHGKSPSPALGKSASAAAVKTPLTSPKSGPGRGRLRTERQNSMPDLRRGDEEGIKSPTLGGRRRKKSMTPEPTSAGSRAMMGELSPLAQPLPEDDDIEHEGEKMQEKVAVIEKEPAADEAHAETTDQTKTSETMQNAENKTELSSEPDEKPVEQNGTSSKKREKLKRLNGLVIPSDLESCAPTAKQIKLDNDSELADKEIEDLLKNKMEVKSPVESPQTEGSITSGDFSSCSSSDVKLKADEVKNMEAETASSELKPTNKEERSDSPNLSSSDKSDTKDKKDNHKVQKSAEKKNNERRHKRRSRGRRDKRKHRLNSGNESTGSDVPPSPGPSSSPFCRPSPGRPRITFDQDLEQIKAKADSTERIRLLQEKIGEMRKIYSSLKAEVASIDRKNKRLRKKREEQAAAAEASDSAKDSKASSAAVASPSIPAVECR